MPIWQQSMLTLWLGIAILFILLVRLWRLSHREFAEEGLLPGFAMPPIPVYSLTTGEAQPFATVYEATEERHTILFVVDYGCTFCREMMAIVPRIAKTYSHMPIKLIIMDENAEQARMMWSLAGRALPAVRVVSDIEVVKKWRIHRFPFVYVINEQGVVVARQSVNKGKVEHFLDQLLERENKIVPRRSRYEVKN
ncbi:thiol-disulfide isomerase/thioredoxin [Paenibacillus sp. DS2015]|uniref:TlpA family protein disulfide reductase n=1 Tax=Paenibacillus sp. DS2015 TaxID=3373917 RepID=UPI003D19793F